VTRGEQRPAVVPSLHAPRELLDRDAARRLAELQAGAMPICGNDGRLKGMVTDRDIAVKVVAQGKDPEATEVAELAAGTPIWVEADAEVDRAADSFASISSAPANN
jgi:CBS domain-containing protein